MANYHPGRAGTGRSRLFPIPRCFGAPALPPLPSWIVLDDSVSVGEPPLNLQQEWALLECTKRTAHGCGEHGQKVLDGLTFYVRLVKPRCLTSALYIDASSDALQSMRAQFGDCPLLFATTPRTDLKLRATAIIENADANHMVMVMHFHLQYFDDLIYYILYDAFDSSLVMMPCPPAPRLCAANCSIRPLTLPRDRGDGAGGYEMVVMSQKMVPPPDGERGDHTYDDVFYMWTPLDSMLATDDDVWKVKGRPVFPQQVEQPFFVETMLCFQGKMFFADLTQGLVSCDLLTSNSTTNVDFIPLPVGVPSALRWETTALEDTGRMDRDRAMGCVQGSIKFVCIDHSAGSYAGVNVTLWTLDVSLKRWIKDKEISAAQLWKSFGFRKKGLPETPPKCPILMPDGSVSFLFPRLRTSTRDPIEDYICNLDLSRMTCRWFGVLDSCTYTTPIMVPGGFFSSVTPPNNLILRMGIFM